MQVLPYWVVAAGVVAAIVIGIVLGGWAWILVAVAVVIGIAYLLADRRMRRHEGPGERLSSRPG